MKRRNDEAILQEHFCHWLDSKGILFNASMAGVYLGIPAAIRRKKMGAKKGFPDIFIYEAHGIYHGLAIELKVGTGKPTPEQENWKMALLSKGYLAVIMPSGLNFSEAFNWLRDVVENYLKQSLIQKEEER